jgi:hypothetical protein
MEPNNQNPIISQSTSEVHPHIKGWLIVILILLVTVVFVGYEVVQKNNAMVKPLSSVQVQVQKTNYVVSENPVTNSFPKELIPVKSTSSQYWDSSKAYGALFNTSSNVGDSVTLYVKSLTGTDWLVTDKKVSTNQASLNLTNNKSKTFAVVDFASNQLTKGSIINIRIQK